MPLTPKHPRWREFTDRLGGPEACDFTDDATGWNCDTTLAGAERILEDMGIDDIHATLDYFHEHGGHCDCEVLFNVDALSSEAQDELRRLRLRPRRRPA